jgi:hypothetical protein
MNKTELKYLIKEHIKYMLLESGQIAGELELHSMTLKQGEDYLSSLGVTIPKFAEHFKLAQKLVQYGKTQRREMPVINDEDVKQFQTRLKKGTIDINKPFAPDTDTADPFPEGLAGFDAEKFLQRGLTDGSKKDDIIGVSIKHVPAKDLKPIQKQIYFDKSVVALSKSSIEDSKKWLSTKTFFITSSDNFIIDGHHRWMSAVLINPSLEVNCLSVDLPIAKLLPLATAYGDSIGNKRNA